MTTVLVVIHIFVTIALIGVVLIQRSEGGGLGIGSSQGMGSFMTGRGTANLLTRTTSILAALFFGLSLALAVLNRGTGGVGRSILDVPATPATTSTPAPAGKVPGLPIGPATGGPVTGGPVTGGPVTGGGAPATPGSAPAPVKPSGPSVPVN